MGTGCYSEISFSDVESLLPHFGLCTSCETPMVVARIVLKSRVFTVSIIAQLIEAEGWFWIFFGCVFFPCNTKHSW